MKKPAWQTDKWLKPFRKAQAAKGPVGLDLLAEVLNWDPDRVDLSNFGVLDSRHRVLHKLTVEAKYAQAKTEWRDILRSVQSEVRKDLLSLLEPAQLSEEEFQYGTLPTGTRILDDACFLLCIRLKLRGKTVF